MERERYESTQALSYGSLREHCVRSRNSRVATPLMTRETYIFFSPGSRRSRKETHGVLLRSSYGYAFTLALPRGLHVAVNPGDTNMHNGCCLRLHLLGDLACHAKALWYDQRAGVSRKLIPLDMQSYFRRSTNFEIAEGRMCDVKGDNHTHTHTHTHISIQGEGRMFCFIYNILSTE